VLHALQEGKYVDAPVVFQTDDAVQKAAAGGSAMCRPRALTRGTPPAGGPPPSRLCGRTNLWIMRPDNRSLRKGFES